MFDPRVGGLVEEVSAKGERAPWGTLLEWNPPAHLVMTWHPGQSSDQATWLAVNFIALEDGRCRVSLIHDGWEQRGEEAGARREGYDAGWNHVLGLFRSAID